MNALALLSALLFGLSSHAMECASAHRDSKKIECAIIFHLPLKEVYLQHIKNGKKTIEGRISKGVFRAVKKDNLIQFYSSRSAVIVKVDRVNEYPDFPTMLTAESIHKMLPEMNDVTDLKKAVDLYRSFPGYREQERIHGVVAIHLSLLK